jgi:hypothetical protein
LNPATERNIAGFIVALQTAPPQSSGMATINGPTIDLLSHGLPKSAVLHQAVGAISGAPSAMTVSTGLAHSMDGNTWTNYSADSNNVVTSTPPLTLTNTDNSVGFSLTSAMRFIRTVTSVAFTGGTSPLALVSVELILGGADKLAAV